MNRRGFLQVLSAGVAGIALEQAIPFGRVWSFPTEIRRYCGIDLAFGSDSFIITEVFMHREALRMLDNQMRFVDFYVRPLRVENFKVGDRITINRVIRRSCDSCS